MPPCRPSRWHHILWRHPPRRVVLSWLGLAVATVCLTCHDIIEECPPLGPGAPEHPAAVMTDGVDGSGMLAELAIPAKPEPWQKTACNAEQGEKSIGGACYLELAEKPPCRNGHFRHDGKCWAAVAKAERPRTSIGQ